MAIINRLPKGLLSLLDIQTQGNNPKEPAEGLRLVSDVTAHYRTQSLLGIGGVAVVDTTDQSSIVLSGIAEATVPEGEVWEIFAAHINYQRGVAAVASEAMEMAIQVRVPSGLGLGGEVDVTVASGRSTFASGNSVSSVSFQEWVPPQRFIANPGTRFRGRIVEANAAMISTGSPNLSLVVAYFSWRI